jgi:hypothetical protein
MTISLRATVLAFFVSIALFSTREMGIAAKADSKLVVRIETAKAVRKGGKIVIQVTGMGRTPAIVRGGGQLLHRGQKHEPNKDGLLEYDLNYVPPANYSGDALKPVKASLVESNIPPGVRGVRIYAEFNERDVMFPESQVKAGKPKKEEFLGTGEPTVSKKEPAVTDEKPKPKKQEEMSRTVVEEKKSRGWNLNPFHRKPKPTPPPQPTPVSARLKKPIPVPPRQEIAQKKKELPAAAEEPKKKSRGWNLNPFHRRTAPAPRTEIVVETKRPAPPRQKPEVTPIPAPKKQEAALERETPPPQTKKKSRGWNLNPFHRRPAEPEVNAVAPPPQKPAPTPTREVTTLKKPEPPAATESTPPKKENVKKKKKKRWEDLNPLNWNPFKHKAPEPETER